MIEDWLGRPAQWAAERTTPAFCLEFEPHPSTPARVGLQCAYLAHHRDAHGWFDAAAERWIEWPNTSDR